MLVSGLRFRSDIGQDDTFRNCQGLFSSLAAELVGSAQRKVVKAPDDE